MSPKDFLPDSDVLATILPMLERVNPDSRERLFETIATYFGFSRSPYSGAKVSQSGGHQTTGRSCRFYRGPLFVTKGVHPPEGAPDRR